MRDTQATDPAWIRVPYCHQKREKITEGRTHCDRMVNVRYRSRIPKAVRSLSAKMRHSTFVSSCQDLASRPPAGSEM